MCINNSSQHQHRSYIGLTAHYDTPDFELKARCLQTTEIVTDHTAQSIAFLLQAFEEQWKIDGKDFAATTDNGSNVVNVM